MTEGIHSVRQKNSSVFTVVIDQLVPVVVVQSPVLVDLERPTAAASSGERQATASNVGADHVSLFEIASQKDQPRRRRSTQFEFQTVSWVDFVPHWEREVLDPTARQFLRPNPNRVPYVDGRRRRWRAAADGKTTRNGKRKTPGKQAKSKRRHS